jgi:hypothetical protein
MKYKTCVRLGINGFIAALAFVLTVFSAFVTHLVWTISVLTADVGATTGQIGFAVLGAVVPPLGAIHGLGLWFGWFAW